MTDTTEDTPQEAIALWSDDKVIDVVSTAADKSRIEDHLLEEDGVAIMFRMRDDYEADRQRLHAALAAANEREEALEVELRDAIFDMLYSSSLPPDKRRKWHARMEELEPSTDATDKQEA